MTDAVNRLHRGQSRRRICRDRHRERIEDEIFFADAVIGRSPDDLLGDRDTLLGRIRDAALIERQSHDETAVLRNEREDHAHDFFFSVDGVDHRFTVISAKTGFHRDRIGRIELQRKIRNCLQFTNCTKQESRLVDFGKTDIDVEELYSRVLLFQGFAEDIVDIVFTKGLLETLLARRVDALTDQDRAFAELDRMRVGRNQ